LASAACENLEILLVSVLHRKSLSDWKKGLSSRAIGRHYAARLRQKGGKQPADRHRKTGPPDRFSKIR